MYKFMRGFFWFGLVYAALVYSFLGGLFLFKPTVITTFAITLDAPHAYSAIRAGFGAQFIALGLTAWWGIFSKNNRYHALLIVTVFTAVIVLCRLIGLTIDGVTPMNLTELRDEGISLIIFVIALACAHRTLSGNDDLS
jgi:hypothetical protein